MRRTASGTVGFLVIFAFACGGRPGPTEEAPSGPAPGREEKPAPEPSARTKELTVRVKDMTKVLNLT